jgi:hypothetical protein
MYKLPSLPMAGEDDTMSPVAYFQMSVPELDTAYTYLSSDPKNTVPSFPMAGDEYIG